MVPLLRNWTSDLSVFSNGPSGLDEEQKAQLKQYNIGLDETPLKALEHRDGQLQRIHLEDGRSLEYQVLYGRPEYEQHCRIPETLGCSLGPEGLLQVEESGRTTHPDVFAAGDNSRMARSISIAVSSGTLAGITINNDLCQEAFRK
jgi:thioredoxin reductase